MSGETVESSSVAARAVVGMTPSMMADHLDRQRRARAAVAPHAEHLAGDAGNDEAVCQLAGATWKPDPEDRDDDGPDDPAWPTDTSVDLFRPPARSPAA